MSARSQKRLHERSRTLLQLGACACIFALMALAARELHSDLAARVLRQAAKEASACHSCGVRAPEAAAPAGVAEFETPPTVGLRPSFAAR